MLNQRAFGLAMGLVYAAMMAVMAWGAGAFGIGREIVSYTEKMYPGYRPTFVGGLVGGLYGFLTGFPMGWLMARLYNSLLHSGAESPVHPVP